MTFNSIFFQTRILSIESFTQYNLTQQAADLPATTNCEQFQAPSAIVQARLEWSSKAEPFLSLIFFFLSIPSCRGCIETRHLQTAAINETDRTPWRDHPVFNTRVRSVCSRRDWSLMPPIHTNGTRSDVMCTYPVLLRIVMKATKSWFSSFEGHQIIWNLKQSISQWDFWHC